METLCTQWIDNNSGFCFCEICSPGDRRLSKLNKKSKGTTICCFIPKT